MTEYLETMIEANKISRNGRVFPKDVLSKAIQDAMSREFLELIVEYPPADLCTYSEYRNKPYFSIKYRENGQEIVGYGTYNPDVLSEYLRDYFMKQKTGHWIDKKPNLQSPFAKMYWCDQCGAHAYKSAYCPGCGAKMEGEKE